MTSYAAECAVTPVRANLFNPGATRTAMRAKAYPGEDPLSLPTPEEVAPAIVAMLAADYAENGASKWSGERRHSGRAQATLNAGDPDRVALCSGFRLPATGMPAVSY